MDPKEVLSRQLESLLTTTGVLEAALEKNPKLLAIVETVLAKVKKTMVGEDGRLMSAPVDSSQSPMRFLADKIAKDRERRENQTVTVPTEETKGADYAIGKLESHRRHSR